MLFDNREIKEHSRKTQRELSKEISSLTSELKDERDRIHELQKENRKLRQEVKPGHKTECPRTECPRTECPISSDEVRVIFGLSYVPRIFNLIKRL